MPSLRRALGRMLVVAVWLVAPTVRAETTRARLTWSRPPGSLCPTSAALEHDVEELTGRPVFTSDAREAQLWVHGEVVEQASGVHARLEARGAGGALIGMRELSAPPGECASLRRPLALVLTMLLDATPPPEQRSHAQPGQLFVGPALGALSGALPRVTPGAGLALVLALWGRLALRLDALYWLPVSIETPAGAGARFQALSGMLAACPRLFGAPGKFAVSACGGGQLGALWASPRGLQGEKHSTRLLAQGSLLLEATLPLGSLALLEAALGPALSFHRPRHTFTRADGSTLEVHRPALFGVNARLDLIIPWP